MKDAALVFLLAALLIAPLFTLDYLDNWGSIESTFIADARFLRDHWPHPQWQPLWYCGTRFDYIYPPGLRFGTAAIAKWGGVEPARAYHLYIAFFYCLGIAGVYALVRVGSGRRGPAWLAAIATALVSPSFLFLERFRNDAGWLEPQRLHVLIRYGEGPHITALAMLGLALAASFAALRTGRALPLAASAVCSALVALNNFYGATALAMFFPVLVWAVWVTHRDWRVWARAAAIAALACGLSAFWLTPSYFRVTLANLKLVAQPGNAWSVWVALAVAAAFAALSWRLAARRKERAYGVFVVGSLVFFSLNVLGLEWFGFRVAGEPHRLVPEMDLAMILAGVEGLRWLWSRRVMVLRVAVVGVLALGLFTTHQYLRHAWDMFPEDPNWRNRMEYRLTSWIAQNLPGQRVMATGSTRFWFNAWYDLPQLGGGSEQGILNQRIMDAMWELLLGPDTRPGLLWLNALGVDAVVVNGNTSQDVYRDFPKPEKFAGVLPVLYDNGKGDVIYRVPRPCPGLACRVDGARAAALAQVRHNVDVERLQPYVEVLERGRAAPARWVSTDELRIEAVGPVLVHVSYDPAWRAYSGGRALTIRKDALNQMLIQGGRGEIRLVFEMPLENQIGWGLTAASALALLVSISHRASWSRRRRRPPAAPRVSERSPSRI